MEVFNGLIGPFKGLIRVFKDLIRPFKGLIRLFQGLIRLFKGLKAPQGPYKGLEGLIRQFLICFLIRRGARMGRQLSLIRP